MADGSFSNRGGGWVVAQLALIGLSLALAPMFRGHWAQATTIAVGLVFLAVGAGFGIAGTLALGRNLTPYPKPLADSTLVQRGVYARVRHPLYSCLMFAAVGWACFWASGVGLALAAALILLLRAKANREERWLAERFPEYRDYARRVKRFVPGIW